MRLILIFLILVSISGQNLNAQEEYEYIGVIKLSDTAFISYKLIFNENNKLLQGYSVTDLGGSHETKSFITGYYDADTNVLNFYESGILYTKSEVIQQDFCFIHFEGKLKQLNDRQGIEGNFEGLYDNGESCINGSLQLLNFRKVLKRAKKLDKKIDRTLLISKEKRDKVNLVRDLDSLNMNIIKKNEALSVFSKTSQVEIQIYDAGQEDGDRISVYVNNVLLLDNYTVAQSKKILQIDLIQKVTNLKVKALNNGSIGSNTVKIDISVDSNIIETITNLEANEQAELIIRKIK